MMILILFQLAFLLFAITVHEFAHGWVAYKLGDPTAKYLGRLSLNPLAHIDPFGTIMLPLTIIMISMATGVRLIPIGWAKPVPINFNSLRNPKRDMLWVGIAGPCANFLLAVLIVLIIKLLGLRESSLPGLLLSLAVLLNLILGIFNLIPVPPLDGSRIVTSLLPWRYTYVYNRIEPYGFIIIIMFLYFCFPLIVRLAMLLQSHLLS